MKAIRLCPIMFALLLASAAQADVVINEETFPDEAFRSLITSLPEGKDGVLTDDDISKITYLSVKTGVTSVKGIEYLTGLTMLDCNYCYVTELDLTANTALEIIRMELVTLETLNVSGLTSLRDLICQKTSLSKLDVSTCTALQYLYVDNGCLTELDLTNNINLKELGCSYNQLTSLDLSNNISLDKLDCCGNQLTRLILPQSETLAEVKCFENHLSGEQMDQLVASLPTVSKGDFYVYLEVADVDEEVPQTEFNVCTTSQVETAKSKNWTVYGIYHFNSGYWEEYAGSAPTSIKSAIQDSTTTERYSLDGRRLATPPTKGLYIQNGRKVVMR